MSTLKTTNIQHPDAVSPAIELDPVDGVVFSAASFDAAAITSGSLAAARLPSGSVVSVKSATKTDVFTASVPAGASVDITGLTISHAASSPSNKILIIGDAMVSAVNGRNAGIGPGVNGSLVSDAIGEAAGTRARVSSSSNDQVRQNNAVAVGFNYLYSPGSTSSVTYSLRAIHVDTGTNTVFVNRGEDEFGDGRSARGASTLTIIEVAA
jgi:hypothetical protein